MQPLKLIDTQPLRDQRSMVGPGRHTTPADVEEAWVAWADEYGLLMRQRARDFSTDLRESRKHVSAYVSAGKWMAKCPGCNDGIACWPFYPRGCCLGCGTIYKIVFPAEAEIEHALAALAIRPEHLRFWHAHEGEPAEQLHQENARLGITPELLLSRTLPLSAIQETLGDRAVEKLRKAGVI